MVQGISKWLLKIYKNKTVLNYDDEIFLYGIEVIATSLFNVLLLLFIGIISGTVNQALVYYVSYATLRKFIGGYHCNTNFNCITFNVSKYILFIWLYQHVEINKLLMISIIIITLILIIWGAPFEHKNRPISENERYKYKKYSFIITSIYAVFILLSSEFYHVLLYVLIVIDLSSIPCIIESNGKSFKNV